MSTDPKKRHNYIACKPVSTYARDDDGVVINPCQKPPEIMKWLCSNHLAPGSTVLVIGAGAGGEVIGAVQACCNVVAVEKDKRQFDALQSILVSMVTSSEVAMERTQKANYVEGSEASSSAAGSDVSFDDSEKATNVTCLECGQLIDPAAVDVNRVCSVCKVSGPLHEGCCAQLKDGSYMCHSCYESQAYEQTVEEL